MSKHSQPHTASEFCARIETQAVSWWQSGSHKTYKMPDGNLITLPMHGGELSKGLRCHLLKVLAQYGMLILIAGILIQVIIKLV